MKEVELSLYFIWSEFNINFRRAAYEAREREREEEESGEVVRDTTFWGGARNYISGFEGSQAMPARPSGRMNALGGLRVKQAVQRVVRLQTQHLL
jgi:hypothetical protein